MLLLSPEGEVVASTGLLSRLEGQSQSPLESEADFAEVLVIAYELGQLDAARLPEAAELSEAPLRFASESEGVLPSPAHAFQGTPGPETALVRITLTRRLTARWVGPCARTACQRFQFGPAVELQVPGEVIEPAEVSLRLPGDDGALFFHEEPNTPVYRFTPPDRIVVLTASIAGPRIRGARTLADGRIALLQEDGRIWIGSGDGGFQPLDGPSPTFAARSLAVARAGDPMEIYVQDRFSDVYALTATSWQRVHHADLPAGENQGLEWWAPGELVYIAPEADRLLRFSSEGRVHQESLDSIKALAFVPGWGPVVAAGRVEGTPPPSLLVLEDAGLRTLEAGLAQRAPLAVWPTGNERETLFGGTNGEVTYYGEEFGRCSFERYTSGSLRGVVTLNAGLLILPGRTNDHNYEGDTKLLFVPFESEPLASCETAYLPALSR
jgi:hypothetical protein